jgi:hypothetical protein
MVWLVDSSVCPLPSPPKFALSPREHHLGVHFAPHFSQPCLVFRRLADIVHGREFPSAHGAQVTVRVAVWDAGVVCAVSQHRLHVSVS